MYCSHIDLSSNRGVTVVPKSEKDESRWGLYTENKSANNGVPPFHRRDGSGNMT